MSLIEQKLLLLDKIKGWFDAWVDRRYQPACGRNCAVCCTTDLGAVTLEAYELLASLKERRRDDLLAKLETASGKDYFRPRITTNTFAMACMTGQDPPEEAPDPNPAPCPLLLGGLCPDYKNRPFACRGIFSLRACKTGSEAEMPPELVSIVTICWQIIEHLDVGGLYGNLIDLVMVLVDEKNMQKYEKGEALKSPGLPPTRPLPGFLVPPEEQDVVREFLDGLFNLDCGGRTFRESMAEIRNSPF
ncbi:MAG: hypothetical protein V1816_21835 [Pseudomonadota bacterium]